MSISKEKQVFSVYENRRGLMDYIGRTDSADAAEAFNIVIARRYKIDTVQEQVEINKVQESVHQIWFRETEYLVKASKSYPQA